jgi:phage/plasmid-like protein (TIGR03299 family)
MTDAARFAVLFGVFDMAHELTIRANGNAEMAFVGTTPWHGLGQRVQEGATIETWQAQSGMDWSANGAAVQYATADGMRTANERQVLYRSDTGAALGVVGVDYKPVQPAEVLEFFRDLTEAGGWHIHTAGTLQGGRKLWAMARNHTEGEASPGDRVRGNLLLATSLDGTMRTIAAMTAVRVVCANTLRLALARTNGADKIAVSHRTQFDADAVKQQLGVARESFEDFMGQARRMAETPIALEEAREVLRRLFGQPPRIISAQEETAAAAIDGGSLLSSLLLQQKNAATPLPVREQRSIPKVLELFHGAGRGADHPGSVGTRWGLFNAVTEHVDHQLGRTPDSRLNSAWFGRGHEVKAQALALLGA